MSCVCGTQAGWRVWKKAESGQGRKSERRVLRILYWTNCTGLLIWSLYESSASCGDSLVFLCTIKCHFPSVPWCLSAFHSTSRSKQELTCTTHSNSWFWDVLWICSWLVWWINHVLQITGRLRRYYSRTCVCCHQLFTRKSPTGDKLCNFLSFAVIKPLLCF